MTDSLAGDLKQHILQAHADGPRYDSHWVMSPEWFSEVRRVEDGTGHPLFQPSWTIDAPQYLLGIPVEVRSGGGVPHLVLNTHPKVT